eukprot:1071458-Rhodomonas_salina.3
MLLPGRRGLHAGRLPHPQAQHHAQRGAARAAGNVPHSQSETRHMSLMRRPGSDVGCGATGGVRRRRRVHP